MNESISRLIHWNLLNNRPVEQNKMKINLLF